MKLPLFVFISRDLVGSVHPLKNVKNKTKRFYKVKVGVGTRMTKKRLGSAQYSKWYTGLKYNLSA